MHCWPSIKQQTKEWRHKATNGAWQEIFKPMFGPFLLLPCVRWLWTQANLWTRLLVGILERILVKLCSSCSQLIGVFFLFLFGHSAIRLVHSDDRQDYQWVRDHGVLSLQGDYRADSHLLGLHFQVDTCYYNHYNARKCLLHVYKLYMQMNTSYITCQSMCLMGLHSD